jgi:hypothetical protein
MAGLRISVSPTVDSSARARRRIGEARKLTHAGAASGAARADEPEQRRRLGDSLKRMRAALLGDEEAGDLALRPRGDQNRAELGEPRNRCGCGVSGTSEDGGGGE